MSTRPQVGFAPRKQALTLYLMDGFDDRTDILARLGTHTTGTACLYIKRLDDVDADLLRELVQASVAHTTARPVPAGDVAETPNS